MANIKSQIKRNKTNEKARLRNKAVRSELRTRVKRAHAVISIANTVPLEPSRPGNGIALRNVRERLRPEGIEPGTLDAKAFTEFVTAEGNQGYKLVWNIKAPDGKTFTSYNYMFKGKGSSQLLLSGMVDTASAAKFEPVFDTFAKSVVVSKGK